MDLVPHRIVLDHVKVKVDYLLDGTPEGITTSPETISFTSKLLHLFEREAGTDVFYVEVACLVFHIMIVEDIHREPELLGARL